MTITLSQLKKMHQQQQKIVCLTAYDAGYAHWVSQAGVDVILVGDSLGMVVQGQQTTLPVTVEEMIYHTRMVQRGNENAWCIADMPFMSDAGLEVALQTAAQLMKQGLANMVKLEGGQRVLPIVEALSSLGVPVCGHLGLLPQSVEKHGYKIQGKDSQTAKRLLDDAQALQQAGADMLVLECVPQALAKQITECLDIPVIGIGSGADTSGQVLVLNDILGVTIGKLPKFAKNYLAEQGTVQKAIAAYVAEVRQKQFPADEYVLA
ncbi:3-methyl-2-oxobutanoate hydroxymethyltransferase [Thiomicrorhabdus sediminis]|uniref:3-methyl-2-oxobutanoate hydroxymethyltransferase n=1 Tax=Thiomicrorhabdus sediminis TaxID=2580412 RepID=A0A4P9K8C1_9GAMM|nr:3-methyl-2-oxobutanoate hydroxymethyltransferase [Thiomicrorhabdus sediminis]QCU90517.1 3-methyl-2-oxobutanoate hydroxymethyltransferase [Thiomicrorhabdus sediminis]